MLCGSISVNDKGYTGIDGKSVNRGGWDCSNWMPAEETVEDNNNSKK